MGPTGRERMVDRNDSLLREVDEELRREQIEKLWKTYGTYAIAAAVAIVIGVGGTKWLETRRIAAQQAAGASYQSAAAALAAKKPEEAVKTLDELAKSGSPGYALIADMRLAGAALEQGRPAEALERFESIAKRSGADNLLKGFAQLQAASIRLGEADFTEMKNRLNDLTVADSPWRANARELLGLAALKAGKTDDARRAFEQVLGERNIPPSVGERVGILMRSVVAVELDKPAPAAAQDSTKDFAKPAGEPAKK